MAVKPMLDDVELQQVQEVEAEEKEALAQQSVPALEGDFLQDLGRRATRVSVSGVLSGDKAGDGLKKLREKFQAATPVPFTADVSTATKVDKVLIEDMGVRDLAGKPERFEYAFTLREFTPPPPPQVEPPPPPPPPPPSTKTGTLVVEVIVEGQPNFDFSTVTVSVDGTKDDGSSFSKTLTSRSNNVWTEQDMPAGHYTAHAVVTDPQPMSGSADAVVRVGQTTRVTITLRSGPPVAVTFVVHFWFDKAFVEPCMLEVLKKVADFAAAHLDQKLLVVGHTDLVGSDDYNQSLSERRSRAVFAALTFGRDQAGAVAEWNTLRRRATGGLPNVSDTWSTREYQYILQDLDYYSGAIDEQHGPDTDAAVRAFQEDNALPSTGQVDDATWTALIKAYLGQEPLSVPESQFFKNSANGCDGGIVKWIGCGEKDPVKNTQDAWRPNRRCELLFVNADRIPCQIPKPVTFDLPVPGAGGTSWCLGPGDPQKRCCFTARSEPQPGKFLIQSVDPSTEVNSGVITFEDGTPAGNLDYVLIAPDGEYMNGERPSGPTRGRPIPGKTEPDGSFAFPDKPKHPGICTLETVGPVLARRSSDPPNSEHSTVICFELTAQAAPAAAATEAARAATVGAPAGASRAVVAPPPPAPVNPSITLANAVVLVKKPHTNPARQRVTLKVSAHFPRAGTFTRSDAKIRFFTAAVGGTEINFDGVDNVFKGAQLSSATGVILFAEAATPSVGPNDVTLTLTLTPGATPVGPAATATMTSVQLDLDLFMSRTTAGVDPAPLPQPPAAAPANPTDKWFGGRFVHVQDPPGNHHGRALVMVKVQPAGFNGVLSLRAVQVSAANAVGAPSNRMQLFDNENPTAGEAAKANPHPFNANTVPAAGLRLFVQGARVSGTLRDTGLQLGLQNVENDGDRVRVTVVQFSHLVADVPSTAANTPRVHPPAPASVVNSPVARHNFDITNFAEDFALASTLVLVEKSVLAPDPANGVPGDPVNLSVRVAPAGVPVQWGVQRDTTALTGDNPAIIALSASATPTLAENQPNQLQATLLADNVGSFFIRPFVDCNGNNSFDLGIDKEPFIVMNLILIRAKAFINNSLLNPPGNVTTIGFVTVRDPLGGPDLVGFALGTGNVQATLGPNSSAVHNDAAIAVIGGGPNGLRGLDRLMAGWVQNALAVDTSPTLPAGDDVVAEYIDSTGASPKTHSAMSIWTPPPIVPHPALAWGRRVDSSGGHPFLLPGTPKPILIPGPFLDASPFGSEGTGGNTAVGTESPDTPGPPIVPGAKPGPGPQPGVTKMPVVPPDVGQLWRVQMWDSPSERVSVIHFGFPRARLSRLRFNENFRTDLCVWTNVAGVAGPTRDAACRLYSSVQTNKWAIRFIADVQQLPPVPPSIRSIAGGSLVARSYFVRVTYTNSAGETTASAEAHLAIPAGRLAQVISPPAVGNTTGYNVYIATTSGNETKQNGAPISIGTNFTEPTTGLVSGAAPPTANTTGGVPITNDLTLQLDPNPNRLATPVQGSGLEVRGPADLRVLGTDARS